ncbi:hypothetical protein AVEN_34160-1, partial [Araneus ventricosus]
VWIFLGDLWVSYATAFAGSMLVEAPMMQLEKIIFRSGNKNAQNPSLYRNNSILKRTLTAEKNAKLAIFVDTDSVKSLGIDKVSHSKL